MICFNRGFSPDEDDNKLLKKLQKLLDEAKDEEINEIVNSSVENLKAEEDDAIIELSTLIDLVYEKLFLQHYDKMQITITKNPNNSLNLNIDEIT